MISSTRSDDENENDDDDETSPRLKDQSQSQSHFQSHTEMLPSLPQDKTSSTIISPVEIEKEFWRMLQPKQLKQMQDSMSSSKALASHLGKALNTALEAYATSATPQAGPRCEALLGRLGRTKVPVPGVTLRPNPESYHLVIQAWQASAQKNALETFNRKRLIQATRRVEALVEHLLKECKVRNTKRNETRSEWLPKAETYAWIIRAYSYAGAPKLGEQMLEKLRQEEEQILAANKEGTTTGASMLLPRPTTFMYNSLLESWARLGRPEQSNHILSAWIRRCERLRHQYNEQAEEVCRPDLESCHLVIRAWRDSSDHKSGPRAELIVNQMKGDAIDTNTTSRVLPEPTVETYNAVLEAWSKSRQYKPVRSVTQAERLLDSMHNQTGKINHYNPAAPNARSYELLLETYARFGHKLPHRKKQSKKLLRKMKHFSIPPTERTLELVEFCQLDGKSLDDVEEATAAGS